ncbi:transglycosylase domain-containing protein [Frankia sp. RB7]|nr:transglycosylase domain-containing protein [Frankia sp. RB7]
MLLALVSLGGVGLLAVALYVVWHLEYEVGVPDVARIAATSGTGPVCRVDKQDPYTPLAEIPLLLQKAIIASEETEFYERPSLNPYFESALAAIFSREPRSSGITWGVTRCLIAESTNCCRGLDWHLGNAYLVNHVARAFSRDRLLEIYLNEMYLGRGSYGVAAAAMAYFGKPMRILTIDEIALLAALHRTPQIAMRRKDLAKDWRNRVIDRMLQAALISEAEADGARQRPIEFRDAPAAIPAGQRSP